MVKDVRIFFQEGNEMDRSIAELYKVHAILSETNVGIGKAFTRLAQTALADNILFLENDWVNIEDIGATYGRLNQGLEMLSARTADAVKYRHRRNPGEPLYTQQYKGREMASPKHLFECCHWVENPDQQFPGLIWKDPDTGLYAATSKYANHTNNPCMYKTHFYLEQISPFAGEGIELEGKIDGWWQEQPFIVAHGEGLFTHSRMDR
jgi:hypothetical protein